MPHTHRSGAGSTVEDARKWGVKLDVIHTLSCHTNIFPVDFTHYHNVYAGCSLRCTSFWVPYDTVHHFAKSK